MSWKEMMLEEFGYESVTTFWDDFSIAECERAIKRCLNLRLGWTRLFRP